jgi:hypothetical protein
VAALRRSILLVAILAGACANAGTSHPGSPDASVPDAAPRPVAPRPGAEIVSAAGRVGAGSITMDVEIGHWLEPRTATAGSRRLVGAAVVNP